MRASRLVRLLGLLQARGRMSAAQLAAELEVSQRTVLRDIEALGSAGVPVYAVRGKTGGFELIEGFTSDLPSSGLGVGGSGRPEIARMWLSPRGRRLAVLTGRPPAIRILKGLDRQARPPGWVQARVPVESADAIVLDVLALGGEAELIAPAQLRGLIRERALRIAELHADLP